jgi:hypothetical protein
MLVPMNFQLQLPYLAEFQQLCLQLGLAPRISLRSSNLAILSLHLIFLQISDLQLLSLGSVIVRDGLLAFLKHTRLYFLRPYQNDLPTSLVLESHPCSDPSEIPSAEQNVYEVSSRERQIQETRGRANHLYISLENEHSRK